jgi:hypothetical protein
MKIKYLDLLYFVLYHFSFTCKVLSEVSPLETSDISESVMQVFN